MPEDACWWDDRSGPPCNWECRIVLGYERAMDLLQRLVHSMDERLIDAPPDVIWAVDKEIKDIAQSTGGEL